MTGVETIGVSLKRQTDDSYDIVIGRKVLDGVAEELAGSGYGQAFAVLCDGNTRPLFAENLVSQLTAAGTKADLIEVAPGEDSKSLTVFGRVLDQLHGLGYTRKDCLVALGGGVVGDLGGYVAGSYMRGIPFVQIPTTLLSQVDSSVGGKVAVNLTRAKNYCGLFNQPKKVFIDTDTLSSLSRAEFGNGLAEVVKYGYIADKDLHDELEASAEPMLALDPQTLARVIRRCCEIKAGVVEKDEREGGHRMILNYGHTVGHAIEAFYDYARPHGECVALGMRVMSAVCEDMVLLPPEDRKRHDALLDRYDLGTAKLGLADPDKDRIMDLMRGDKKADRKGLKFVVLQGLGKARVTRDVDPDLIRRSLSLIS